MPCLFDPSARLELTLQGDAEIPDGERPKFYAKVLTGRQWFEYELRYDATLAKELAYRDRVKQRFDLLRDLLVGWDNINNPAGEDPKMLPFSPDKLEDVLSVAECSELIVEAMAGGQLTRADRKNSESPRSSSTDNSASSATAASA